MLVEHLRLLKLRGMFLFALVLPGGLSSSTGAFLPVFLQMSAYCFCRL